MPEPHVYGHLEYVWMVAYETGDAVIGDAIDVELAAQWVGEPGKFCKAMVDVHLLDSIGDGRFAVHDLLDHAPDYVQQRARREAERRKEKQCGYCGATFHSSELHAAYCSAACRQGAYRDRRVTEGDEGSVTRDANVTDGDGGVRNGVRNTDTDFYAGNEEARGSVTDGDGGVRNSVTERDARVTERDARVTGCDAPPAPAPAPAPKEEEETPLPPPSGGNASAATKTRKKRREATTEQEAAAQRVVDHYQAAVAPAHGKEGGAKNVLTLLSQAIDEATLLACADRYAATCRAQGTEPQYRMKVRNFYGKAAGYRDYLHEQPGPAPGQAASETLEQYAARQGAENAELDRRLARRQQGRGSTNGEATSR
jgi:hypothetical protein